MLECVVNVSEGRDARRVGRLARSAGPALLDVHVDADHHRSVLTLAGDPDEVGAGVRRLAATAVAELDLGGHVGVHPRLGVLDVVPWVALERGADGLVGDGAAADAVAARDGFARWAATSLALPCFLYGPASSAAPGRPDPAVADHTLPELRRRAWRDLRPAVGPAEPHPTAGAVCVGARPVLVAYNLWLADADAERARTVARAIRRPGLRTLGLQVGRAAQVSCNLVDPSRIGPADVYDAVAALVPVARAELVGLLPRRVLDAVPVTRWQALDLGVERTIEARLERRASTGEAFRGPTGST